MAASLSMSDWFFGELGDQPFIQRQLIIYIIGRIYPTYHIGTRGQAVLMFRQNSVNRSIILGIYERAEPGKANAIQSI